MSESKVIEWTLPMLKRFGREYRIAVDGRKETFMFDGNEFLVSYAGYLIEFLEQKFGLMRSKPR